MTSEPAPAAAPSAHEMLGPTLLALVESVRSAARRVIASASQRGPRADRRRGAPEERPRPEGDDEAVHDFRVALRRLRTLLRPARRVYGKKRLGPIADDLRAYAQATGALRDEEVLRETLTSLTLEQAVRGEVDAWIARRSRKERGCRAAVVELLREDVLDEEQRAAGGTRSSPARNAPSYAAGVAGRVAGEAERSMAVPHMAPALAALEKRLRKHKGKRQDAATLAARTVEEALAGVRDLCAGDPADGARMHALRIRFKRLRYSAETFAPLLGERAVRVAKSAAKMQRRLGQLHDADEALLRMRRARGLSPEVRAAVIEALHAERARLVGKAAHDLAEELATLTAEWPAA